MGRVGGAEEEWVALRCSNLGAPHGVAIKMQPLEDGSKVPRGNTASALRVQLLQGDSRRQAETGT